MFGHIWVITSLDSIKSASTSIKAQCFPSKIIKINHYIVIKGWLPHLITIKKRKTTPCGDASSPWCQRSHRSVHPAAHRPRWKKVWNIYVKAVRIFSWGYWWYIVTFNGDWWGLMVYWWYIHGDIDGPILMVCECNLHGILYITNSIQSNILGPSHKCGAPLHRWCENGWRLHSLYIPIVYTVYTKNSANAHTYA